MSATARAIGLAQTAAQAAAAKLGQDIVALDVSEKLAITDIFLIASGANERQVGAIVDAVDEALLAAGVKAARREGEREGRWVLLDFLDLVVHVQHAEDRAVYSLERLWKDAPRLPLPGIEALPSGPAAPADAPAGASGDPLPTPPAPAADGQGGTASPAGADA